MTEPDPLAGLGQQVADLLAQLARAQGDIGALRERLEAGSSQEMMLRLEVKQLRDRLEEAISNRKLKSPPAPWWRVGRDEGEAMLADLREWVERFLWPHYPDYMSRLPACYWRHMEALWELSTLRAEWERVYADEDNRDLAGALNWHDRLLPGVLGRLAGAIKCAPGGCRLARPR